MTRLAETTAHIASMNELLDIVGAMRSLAGMRMQEAQRSLAGIRRYAATVASAIADTPAPVPPAATPSEAGRAVILCTSEHGFVGGFNERMLSALEDNAGPPDALFVLGSRGAAMTHERGMRPAWTRAMATRIAAVGETVDDLTRELYRRIAAREITRVDIVFARYRQAGASAIERRTLFPVDPSVAPSKRLQQPLFNLDPGVLHEELLAEYVVALLTEAAVESLASENAARFAAMQSAHGNVSKKLEELQQQARLMRQNEITSELLELVTGAEAMAGR
jgi:F-type H+-transporting ATPase subunit gamma